MRIGAGVARFAKRLSDRPANADLPGKGAWRDDAEAFLRCWAGIVRALAFGAGRADGSCHRAGEQGGLAERFSRTDGARQVSAPVSATVWAVRGRCQRRRRAASEVGDRNGAGGGGR